MTPYQLEQLENIRRATEALERFAIYQQTNGERISISMAIDTTNHVLNLVELIKNNNEG